MTRAATSVATPSVLRIQAVLVTIALCAGLAIATVHELTRPLVQAQRGGLLGQAALEVLPGAVSYRIYGRGPEESLAELQGPEGAEFFLGLDAQGQAVGAAVVASGMGYQDTIQLIYGLDPVNARLLGMRVVASRETPGLGSVIVEDADWVASFGHIVLQFDNEGTLQSLRVREQARHEQGEVDAITGATVSVRSVARIINRSLAEWLPILRASYDALGRDDRG